MEAARYKTVNRTAAVQPAAALKNAPRPAAAPGPVRLQTALQVSSPQDAAEKEADATAKKIMRLAIPESTVAYIRTGRGGVFRQVKKEEKEKDKKPPAKLQSPYIARFAASGVFNRRQEEKLQRKAEGQPEVSSKVAADIQSSTASGTPLPLSVRRFMEPRFRTDFSQVRVHTGERSAQLSRQVNARAFTVGKQIFFGREQYKPESQEGRELIAHELTHTIQQGAVIQRSEEVSVTQQSPVQVQRLGMSDVLDYVADKANLIPGFRMLTIILGVNPINMSRVERSAANILRALIEFIPGGGLITKALDNYGIFDKVGNFVEQQIKSLGLAGSAIKQAVTAFIGKLELADITDLEGVWNRAKRIFTEPIDRIINCAKGLGSGILQLIKDVILRPLAKLAEGTQGYDLLKAVLGEDPVTGDPVTPNADMLIGGFMKLAGQEEVWNNLKKANAVARAWAWFQGAVASLRSFVRQIPQLFITAFKALVLEDILELPGAFKKVASVFADFIGKFMSWATDAVWNLLEIIFAVVAPGALAYIRKAGGAFRSILKNPIGFVGNLVRAGKQGLLQFAGNIGKHLKTSLIQWVTGALSGAGVYIPQSFEIREIIKFVLSVLRVTWQNVRQKLVKVVGETAMRALETGFDIVVTLVTQGPAAAWEKIKEQLSNLKEMIMEGIISFVTNKIVESAITKLVSMLNPVVGGIIQGALGIYNTVMFFVERMRQIAQVAAAFIDSIAAIAGGAVAAAASRVEQTLAGLLVLAISFLARLAGLGKVSDAVVNIINRVRAPIDRALDRVVEWIVAMAKKLFAKVFGKKDASPEELSKRLDRGLNAAQTVVNRFAGKRVAEKILHPLLATVRLAYRMQSLEVFPRGQIWFVRGTVNPGAERSSEAYIAESTKDLDRIIYHALVDLSKEMYVGLHIKQISEHEESEIARRLEKGEKIIDQSLVTKLEKTIAGIQIAYGRACIAKWRHGITKNNAPNVFSVLNESMFVLHSENNYVVPTSSVEDVVESNGRITATNAKRLASEFSYHPLPVSHMKAVLLGGGNPKQKVYVVAAVAAEPSRYSITHVTTLLALELEPSEEPAIKGTLSMTGGGTDPSDKGKKPGKGKKIEIDPRLKGTRLPERDMPKEVTDRDLAIVKRQSGLMEQINRIVNSLISKEEMIGKVRATLRAAIRGRKLIFSRTELERR
ncbi:MAG: DUF4157 domain-containing protein [Candidatus Competibacteraceae bacterium]